MKGIISLVITVKYFSVVLVLLSAGIMTDAHSILKPQNRQKWLILHSSCIYCCLTIHRMNNGPVLGHEEDVGRRTTFRLFYPESVFSDPTHNDPNTTAVLIVFKPQDLRWLLEIMSGTNIVSWQNYLVPITFSISLKEKCIHNIPFSVSFISEH